ncbi:hypothetical protein GUJ93_ZPchr0004g38144 [Zizania palustris]|uniref:Uncharacterized protein n=1 Tax=Zizania palustris TaxID=103762 RepID=A0A8J5SPL4_ZIZPA|nr:hypothetical protein GUJ93_ZPchr0004g38144 [Zizania palustris]
MPSASSPPTSVSPSARFVSVSVAVAALSPRVLSPSSFSFLEIFISISRIQPKSISGLLDLTSSAFLL